MLREKRAKSKQGPGSLGAEERPLVHHPTAGRKEEEEEEASRAACIQSCLLQPIRELVGREEETREPVHPGTARGPLPPEGLWGLVLVTPPTPCTPLVRQPVPTRLWSNEEGRIGAEGRRGEQAALRHRAVADSPPASSGLILCSAQAAQLRGSPCAPLQACWLGNSGS